MKEARGEGLVEAYIHTYVLITPNTYSVHPLIPPSTHSVQPHLCTHTSKHPPQRTHTCVLIPPSTHSVHPHLCTHPSKHTQRTSTRHLCTHTSKHIISALTYSGRLVHSGEPTLSSQLDGHRWWLLHSTAGTLKMHLASLSLNPACSSLSRMQSTVV